MPANKKTIAGMARSTKGNTSTGTLPLGDAANMAAGLSRNSTSRNSTLMPLAMIAARARMA